MLSTSLVQHFVQMFDLPRQIARSIAHEKTVVVSQLRIANIVHNLVVVITNNIMPGKTTSGDHPESDAGVAQAGKNALAVDLARRCRDQRKRETGTFDMLALDDKPSVISKHPLKERHVLPPRQRHARQLFQLLAAH